MPEPRGVLISVLLVIISKMNIIDSYVTCPLEVSHRILSSRLQTHLYKCYKNFPKDTKIKCIYDATHILDFDEYEQHLEICPSSGNVRCYNTILEPVRNVGIPIQQVCSLQTNTTEDEDWYGNNPSYNPLAASEKKNVIRPAIAMSKTEKKKFREYERQRLLSLEKENNEKSFDKCNSSAQKQIGCDEPLRIPKNIAKAVSYDLNASTSSVISRLKDISINSNNDIPDSENSCKLNLNSSKTNADIKTISPQNNNSQLKQKEDIPNVKKDTCASSQNMKMKDDTLGPINSKTSVNTLKENLETHNIKQKPNKYYTSESQNGIELGVQRGILHGEPKKVSTGRGFILAYQRSGSDVTKGSNRKAGSTLDRNCDKN